MFGERKRYKIIADNSKNGNNKNAKNMSYNSLSRCYVSANTISTFHVSS